MKIIIQTGEAGINRLFGLESDVTIIKSLELQTKDLMKNNEGTTLYKRNAGSNS